MGQFYIADLLPMPPWEGPPLPRFLGIYWPWVEGESPGSFLSLPEFRPLVNPAPEPQPALTTYENTESIQLEDIDEETSMPRKIIIKRKSQRLE